MVNSTTRIEIERSSRYAKQLASHMGHKIPVQETSSGWELTFGSGRATLTPSENHLVMTVRAENPDDLEGIKFALVKHLVKFAAKLGELEIAWK